MNKTLSFSEVLNVEELAPTELDAIVGGKFGLKIIGANGHQCSCGNGNPSTLPPLLPLRILQVQLNLKYFISR